MKEFDFKKECKELKNSFSTVLLLSYLFGLLVYNFIKNNIDGKGVNLNITIILLIVVIAMFILITTITITYVIIFKIKSKAVDINFSKIKECQVFQNINNMTISSKEDILNWYNIVEYDMIEKKENLLNPSNIIGNEHVWLVTSDLEPELTDTTLISTIKNNIAKGIKYTYFLPDNDNIHLDIERLNNIYGEEKIIIVLLDKQSKLLFNLFDVIIFDPINDHNNAFICVEFTKPRKYRKLMADDVKNLITKLNKEKMSSKGGTT